MKTTKLIQVGNAKSIPIMAVIVFMPISAISSDTWNNKNQTTNVCEIGWNKDYAGCVVFSAVSLDDLVSAIAEIESNGRTNIFGDHGKAAGCLQIHRSVLLDVNRQYGTCYEWPRDALNPHHARNICKLYLRIYCSNNSTAEKMSRCWNGGPEGYKKKSTEHYWLKVKKILK